MHRCLAICCLLVLALSVHLKAQVDVSTGPESDKPLHILGARYQADSVVIALSKYSGNSTTVQGVVHCREESSFSSKGVFSTVPAKKSAVRAMIIIDNSVTSAFLAQNVVTALSQQLQLLDSTNAVGVWTVNQDINEITPPVSPQHSATFCESTSIPDGSGVNTLYSATVSALAVLRDVPEIRTALFVVAASDDNASVANSLAQCVTKAVQQNTRVYVIRVGSELQHYTYRYLSNAAGGRITTISNSPDSVAAYCVRTIEQLQEYSTIQFPIANLLCRDLIVSIVDTARQQADSLVIPISDRTYYVAPFVVSLFADTNEVGVQDYYPVLGTLAEALLADTSATLQLTGHVSATARDPKNRSLERASFVKDFLVGYGVPEHRINTKGAGSTQPKFYREITGNQYVMNNRVEAVITHSSDLPYTIEVASEVTEEKALKHVQTWIKRGYQAYFEPRVVKAEPSYRIILWGYKTKAEATIAASALKKKFSVTGYVQ